jgi:hypothetical protein
MRNNVNERNIDIYVTQLERPTPTMLLHFPDPDFEKPFQAYSSYVQDLAGTIGGQHGWSESLVAGVHDAVGRTPGIANMQRRPLDLAATARFESCLRKAWGNLRRVVRETEDDWVFDEEANAWLPVQAYYAVYHAVLALASASGQPLPPNHNAALGLIGAEVTRGRFPVPWSAYATGCPQLGTVAGHGVQSGSVHVLSAPDPSTAEQRLAMFLRTTRERELERLYAGERARRVQPGRSRRNLAAADKEAIAGRMRPTTVFDLFWRLRKKASYDDADVFVLGASSERDARRFGESLVIVTDATVAAIEGLIAAYLGPAPLARAAELYARRTPAAPTIAARNDSWSRRASLPQSGFAGNRRASEVPF